jgi:hypothetical protein
MLILKQNSANSVPTPPAGKGTIFLDDSDTLSVKTSDGNVETFPTVAAANTQVVFIDGTALTGNSNFTYNKNTNTLTLSGTLAAGNVKTDNLLYANGSPWDLSDPGGANTQVQFNDDESFGGSAAFTFNKTSNAVTMSGNLSAGNVNGGNLVSANYVSGTLTTAAQPNITSVGTLTDLSVSGNAVIGGNLAVNGNVTYVNVDTLQVEDPVISLGGGPNGAPLTSNDGKDRGTLLNYYTTSAIDGFMGWDNSNGEFAFGSNVSIVNDVVTFNTLGNVRVGNIIGNGQALTGLTGANVTGQVGNALVAGTVYTNAQPNITSVGTLTSLSVTGNVSAGNVNAGNLLTANFVTGTLTTAAQPNVTSVGTLTSLLTGTSALGTDFPNATSIFAHDNTGVLGSDNFGLVGEATGDSANASTTGVGVFGIGKANGGTRGTGVQGFATVTNSGDTGAAVGVRGYATTTHSGGYNIGVLGNAAGSGFGNYAFYIQAGNIASIETDTAWDLNDNSATSLSFNSSGKANILRISTVDSSEGVAMSGTLAVTGNITATAGIKTDNYYYANGSPVDFQQAGGTNTQIQFNDADSFGGSAAFTFDKTSNLVTMSGNLSVANVQATGAITGATVTSNGNANVGNLGTAGLITATGNVSGGNLTTGGVVAATGNVSGGNLTTGGVVAATGNVSGGNLTTGGALSVTGNANVGNLGTGGLIVATGNVTGGNINTAGKVVAPILESNVTTGTAPFTVASTTKVTNLNADLLDGFSTATAATANTVVIRDADGSFSANVVTATLSGAATTAGTVTTAAQPNITSVGTLSSLAVTGNGTFGNVYANAGTIGALTLKGEGGNISNVTAGNITGQVANALVAGTVYTNAQPNITSVGTLSSLSVTGNVSAGNVSGTLLTGTLATAAQPNVTSVGTLTVLDVNGNITAANITANTGVFTGNGSGLSQLAGGNVTGQVGNALVASTVYTNAQPNITSVGTLSSLAVTANVAAGNLTTTGVLSVTGTGVSSIAGNLDMTSNNIINLATPVAGTDAATKQYVDDLASTALVYHEGVTAATTGTLASATGGTITYNNGASGVGATLTTTGTFNLIDTANVQTVGTRILVKNEANAAHNGVYTYTSTTVITRATDADTYGPGAGELSLNNYFFVSGGDVNKGSAYVVDSPTGTITFGTSNITFAQFSSSQVYLAGTGLTLSNLTFSVNASQTQVTALGTVTTGTWNSLVGSSATFAAGLSGANLASITGANVTGTVPAATVAGTVTTAAQPNITSVGTLTGLGVNGTVTAVAFTANTGVFTGNGSGLSAIAGANVTGTVGSATTAGTVTTAAQPNITSVGTLSSLAVTGNASAGNLNTAGAVVASTLTSNVTTGTAPLTVTSTTRVANLNVAYANVADNINVTTQSSGNAFLVFANALTGNVAESANAAFVANTSNGALYATTFIGAVSGNGAALTDLNASNISTGTLAQARLANSSLTVNGTSIALGGTGTITANTTQTLTLGSFLTGTSFNGGTAVTAAVDATSANTASKVVARDASGNFSAGTITATLSGAATTAGTVTTAAQPNITSVGTLTGLTVSGNLVCGGFFDASVNAAVSAAGTAQGNATVIASEINVVSTVASGAGVALPTAVAGVRVTLINTAANTLLVYPASGGAINSLATNAGYSLPAGGRLEYVAVSTTQWYTLNATYG